MYNTSVYNRKFRKISEEFIPFLEALETRERELAEELNVIKREHAAIAQSCWDSAWDAFKEAYPTFHIVDYGSHSRKDVALEYQVNEWDGSLYVSKTYDLQDAFEYQFWMHNDNESVTDPYDYVRVRPSSCYSTSNIDKTNIEYYTKWLAITNDLVCGAPWVDAFKKSCIDFANTRNALHKASRQPDSPYSIVAEKVKAHEAYLSESDVYARLFTAENAGLFKPENCTKIDWEWHGIKCNRAKEGLKTYLENKPKWVAIFDEYISIEENS